MMTIMSPRIRRNPRKERSVRPRAKRNHRRRTRKRNARKTNQTIMPLKRRHMILTTTQAVKRVAARKKTVLTVKNVLQDELKQWKSHNNNLILHPLRKFVNNSI
jgi:hypothetical protein